MGYKMPIVCKEVYLPVDPTFLMDEPTIEEYNKHYGVDLLSIVNVVYDGDNNVVLFIEPKNTKVYLVLNDYGVHKLSCVRQANSPLITPANSPSSVVNYCYSDVKGDTFGFGLVFHLENGKPNYLSLFEI